MAHAIEVTRRDYSSVQLRQEAKRSGDGRAASRILAIVHVLDEMSRMARLTYRQGHLRRSGSERYRDLCGGSGIRIEEFASLKHRMHYNRQFARHGRTASRPPHRNATVGSLPSFDHSAGVAGFSPLRLMARQN